MRSLSTRLMGLCGAVLLTACTMSPTGRQQLNLFPETYMAQMGAAAFTSLREKQEAPADPARQRYVRCVVDALVPSLRTFATEPLPEWEVAVFVDDAANAFALPGGKIGVHTGMLAVADNPDRLAAVLAHEMAHVWARHGNERVSQGFLAQSAVQLVAIAAGETSAEQQRLMALLGTGTQVGVLLPFSRRHESEADAMGLRLMAHAGFDPRESVALWRHMARESDGPRPPELLSTHPATETRMRDLEASMDEALRMYRRARQAGRRPDCRP